MSAREKKKAAERKAKRAEAGAVSHFRGIRMSARKARALADLIRGQSVEQADTVLAFQRRRAAEPLRKCLAAAVANADQRNMDVDALVVAMVQVNKGPIMRRFMPRAHGRATRIRKQTSHIHIELAEAK